MPLEPINLTIISEQHLGAGWMYINQLEADLSELESSVYEHKIITGALAITVTIKDTKMDFYYKLILKSYKLLANICPGLKDSCCFKIYNWAKTLTSIPDYFAYYQLKDRIFTPNVC